MNTQRMFREMMRAVATGDADEARRISGQLDGEAHGRLNVYSTAVLSIVLGHRFAEDSSRGAIQEFMDQLRHDYRKANPPIKPLMVEGVIRAFAGEEHLLDEIPAEEQLNAQYPVIRKIVADSPELSQRIDDILTDAETLVHEWETEDA